MGADSADKWTGEVTGRVAELGLDIKGRLSDASIVAVALNCSLLLDLARLGRLDHADDAITVDTTTTGFPPADRALEALACSPGTLHEWCDQSEIPPRQVLDALVETGLWSVEKDWIGRRRFRVVGHEPNAVGYPDIDLAHPGLSQVDACVAVVASTAGMLGTTVGHGYWAEPSELPLNVTRATGDLDWVCGLVRAHLGERRRRDGYQGRVWA